MSRIDIGSVCTLIRSGQVPALSIRQPWAYRIMHRGKDIENCTWSPKYRGWLMIHAGKAVDREVLNDFQAHPRDPRFFDEKSLGGILGIVRLCDVVTDDPSPWFLGPVGLVLKYPFRLPEIVHCKGQLGMFNPDQETREAVIKGLLQRTRAKEPK